MRNVEKKRHFEETKHELNQKLKYKEIIDATKLLACIHN